MLPKMSFGINDHYQTMTLTFSFDNARTDINTMSKCCVERALFMERLEPLIEFIQTNNVIVAGSFILQQLQRTSSMEPVLLSDQLEGLDHMAFSVDSDTWRPNDIDFWFPSSDDEDFQKKITAFGSVISQCGYGKYPTKHVRTTNTMYSALPLQHDSVSTFRPLDQSRSVLQVIQLGRTQSHRSVSQQVQDVLSSFDLDILCCAYYKGCPPLNKVGYPELCASIDKRVYM